jgi:hypothetical protein
MSLRGVYSNSTGSNVDISARIRAYQMEVMANAEEGSVAMSTLMVDDPEGGINILGLRGITLTETAEASNQLVIFKGWTADRDVTRGDSMRTGAARLWAVQLTDSNSLISRRIMRGSDANRPAETDVARVQWLMTTSEFGGTVTNSTYISTSFPVAMDAVDYRNQSNQQILDDCAQASGKNYFIIWREEVSAFGLFYDFAGASPYRSAIRLTNILGYVDSDITFGVINEGTKLNRDPSRVYSGVVLPYVGGEVYVQNSAIAAEFVSRDTMAPSVNVKTSAKATARANRYIFDASTESDVISTSFLVPLNAVNHLREGMQVQCRFAHMPGYGDGWNWMRVLRRTVTATSEEYYTVSVDMAAGVGGLYAGGGLTTEGATWPASEIIDPAPLQTCTIDGQTYTYTAGGTRGPLPPTTIGAYNQYVSTTFMQYWRAGGSISGTPLAGLTCALDETTPPSSCYSYSGGHGNLGGGADVGVRITTIGPGTLTVNTAANNTPIAVCTETGGTPVVSATNSPSDSGPDCMGSVLTDSGVVGTPLVIVVPDDGCCGHYTDITAPKAWAFVSATWVP